VNIGWEGTAMPIRVIVAMDALPGKGNELVRARAERHAEVRKEPGCY